MKHHFIFEVDEESFKEDFDWIKENCKGEIINCKDFDDIPRYYFITVFTKIAFDEAKFPDIGASRCWGFYKEKETAIQAVKENWTNMWETCYNYAMIEEYEEGISGATRWRKVYKFNKENGGYDEIEEPKEWECFHGFALG